jgi:hypothetical protein
LAPALVNARTTTELAKLALPGLSELVPADVLTWDRVELATGAVHHEARPAEAEPLGAFAATVGTAAGHPLLARMPNVAIGRCVSPRPSTTPTVPE